MRFDKHACSRVLVDEEAPTFPEYGILLVLIALLVLLSVVVLGDGISTLFQRTGDAFTGVTIPAVAMLLGF